LNFVLTKKKTCEIPVLELYSQQAHQKRPLVIMMHGLAARKENALPYAYYVAKEGYHAILFDAHDHGELETARFKKASDPEKKAHMFTVIFKSSASIDAIITALAESESVDINRVGLIGFSMGGMIVYDYLCQRSSPHVKAAVSIIATPEWGASVRRGVAQDANYAKHFDEKKIRHVEDRQPANHLSVLKDFPLLILNGASDEIMPIEDIRGFYHLAKRKYTHKELIQLIVYEGIGHTPTFEMISEAVLWLKKHL
jgi:dienelactone hydrolase